MDLLKFKRGLFRNLPKRLEIGEPAYCYDTGELYIGDETGKPDLLAVPKTELDGGPFNLMNDEADTYEVIMDGGDF